MVDNRTLTISICNHYPNDTALRLLKTFYGVRCCRFVENIQLLNQRMKTSTKILSSFPFVWQPKVAQKVHFIFAHGIFPLRICQFVWIFNWLVFYCFHEGILLYVLEVEYSF